MTKTTFSSVLKKAKTFEQWFLDLYLKKGLRVELIEKVEVEKLKNQLQESLDKKTKDDFKALLKKIALHLTEYTIKPDHAKQVLSDIDGDNHFVNVSWYFALGYSYALREVLGCVEAEKNPLEKASPKTE